MPCPPLPASTPATPTNGDAQVPEALRSGKAADSKNVDPVREELDHDQLLERFASQESELNQLRNRNSDLEKQVAELKANEAIGMSDSRKQTHDAVADLITSEGGSLKDNSTSWTENYEKGKFSISQIFPPLSWVPMYIRAVSGKSSEKDRHVMGALKFALKGDLIAGMTVGVMLVPQCLAFALLAGMPVQVGLYSSFAPLIMYAAFGTIRQVQPGPTALMSLLTGQALDNMKLETDAARIAGGAILAATAGALSVLLGVLRFGFIVDFMSHTVMQGFCSAAGVTIASSQLKHLLGIKMDRKKYWWKTIGYLVSHINEIDWPTFALGGSLLGLLLMLKYWKQAGNAEKRRKHLMWRWFPVKKESIPFRVLKLIADLSSILCVCLGWCWGLIYRKNNVDTVKMVGEVNSDGFTFGMPGDGIMDDLQIGSVLLTGTIMCIVGFLETMAVGGKFAMAAKYEYDANQELLALGISNLAGSFMSAYPTTGSFSRTAVNAMLGATSLLSCALSAILVFIATYVLLPVIRYLPLAALAPIIIQGAIGVISFKDFKNAYSTSKPEFVVMLFTFTVSLGLTVKEGLATGVALSVLKTLRDLANPNLCVCGLMPDDSFRDIRNFTEAVQIPNTVVVRMDARLGFFNSRKMKEFCLQALAVRKKHDDHIKFLVIDAKPINNIDLTGAEMLEGLSESLEEHEQTLIIAGLKTPVMASLTSAGFTKHLKHHGGHVCTDMEHALNIVTAKDARGSKNWSDNEEIVKKAENSRRTMPKAGACVLQ
jgi:high affinity sulfate transporter 1